MDRKTYNKLVRDRIPEIIARSSRQLEVSTLTPAEFEIALREKIVEEAMEAQDADAAHLLTELADLQEVMHTLMRFHGITSEMVDHEQERRRLERGGFEQRVRLIWTE